MSGPNCVRIYKIIVQISFPKWVLILPEVHWLHVPKWLMQIFTEISWQTLANCEATGCLNGLKITHSTLTYLHYLMFKREVPSVYTFGVENIQKFELRPLHKFAQAASQCSMPMAWVCDWPVPCGRHTHSGCICHRTTSWYTQVLVYECIYPTQT